MGWVVVVLITPLVPFAEELFETDEFAPAFMVPFIVAVAFAVELFPCVVWVFVLLLVEEFGCPLGCGAGAGAGAGAGIICVSSCKVVSGFLSALRSVQPERKSSEKRMAARMSFFVMFVV